MSSPSKLLTLPPELIEAVLISSCSPRTVANVAQTCRTLHTLIYDSPDSHLWRGLFLTIWDDPRPALEHNSLVDPRIDSATWDWGVEYRRRVSADRWFKAWRRNICRADDSGPTAVKTAGPPAAHAYTDQDWYTATLSSLSALLSTLLTLTPFPATPPIALTMLTHRTIYPYPTVTGNAPNGASERRERMTSAPPLPPLLILLASGFMTVQASEGAVRAGRLVYGPHATQALTSTPIHPMIPTPSLPPQLVRTLLASHAVDVRGMAAYVPNLSAADLFGGDALVDVFHRIVCITGFVPIPPPFDFPPLLASTHIHGLSTGTQNSRIETATGDDGVEQRGENHTEQTPHLTKVAFPTPSQQHADARLLARRRVYDMTYLRGDRLWGPFQPVTRESPIPRLADGPGPEVHSANITKEKETRAGTRSSMPGDDAAHHLGELAWAMGADIELDNFDSTSDDSKDGDWLPPADTGRASSSTIDHTENDERESTTGGPVIADTEVDTETELAEPEHPLISLILASTEPISHPTSTESPSSSRRTRRSNLRLLSSNLVHSREIQPQHLRPDYTYLASVRIVVEANLRDLFGRGISDNVEDAAPEVRPGEVGMFWEEEDEILRGDRSFRPVPSSSRTSSSATSPPNPSTFDLVDILSRFQNLEVARLGSTCGFWNGWTKRQQSASSDDNEVAHSPRSSSNDDIGVRKPRIVVRQDELEKPTAIKAKGKGKEKERNNDSVSAPVPATQNEVRDWEIGPAGEECEGWDWAGVSGIWRRCVCWMDYRELLFFNLDSTKFLTLDTQEACRIIPMEVQITGYSRAGLMPIHDIKHERDTINVLSHDAHRGPVEGYFRPPPVIHFSGFSIGSDRSLDEGRTVSGSVQLIGGGEVRWQMDIYTQGSSSPEWSTEAVQVGGMGSVVGLLGMWTGGGHERADPLGPFWAWKVA